MPLITFIPIPTKFVGAGFPADVYIYNAPPVWTRAGASVRIRVCVYARVPSGACLSTTGGAAIKIRDRG